MHSHNNAVNKRVCIDFVLILVLMEDALAQIDEEKTGRITGVLILVLMEDALAPGISNLGMTWTFSLNPCFNGRCTRTI